MSLRDRHAMQSAGFDEKNLGRRACRRSPRRYAVRKLGLIADLRDDAPLFDYCAPGQILRWLFHLPAT
ncbi:hypothetical protein DXU07_02455 [Bradyrhizobium elkanii]